MTPIPELRAFIEWKLEGTDGRWRRRRQRKAATEPTNTTSLRRQQWAGEAKRARTLALQPRPRRRRLRQPWWWRLPAAACSCGTSGSEATHYRQPEQRVVKEINLILCVWPKKINATVERGTIIQYYYL